MIRSHMNNDRMMYPRRSGLDQICRYCQKGHRKADACHILCKYCFGLHLKQTVKNGICPKLSKYSEKERDKHALPCRECEGHGFFQKKTVTIYRQTADRYQNKLAKEKSQHFQYQKRERQQEVCPKQADPCPDDQIRKAVLKQVLASMKLLKVEEDQKTDKETEITESADKKRKLMKRKILYKHKQIKNQICETCSGAGKIDKLTHCCSKGCKKCNYEKEAINQIWLKYKMEGFQCEQSFNCHLCDQDTIVGVKTLKLDCGHIFHHSCCFKWLFDHNSCPICRQIDFFINYQKVKMIVKYETKQLPLPKDNINVLPIDFERQLLNDINISDIEKKEHHEMNESDAISNEMKFESQDDW